MIYPPSDDPVTCHPPPGSCRIRHVPTHPPPAPNTKTNYTMLRKKQPGGISVSRKNKGETYGTYRSKVLTGNGISVTSISAPGVLVASLFRYFVHSGRTWRLHVPFWRCSVGGVRCGLHWGLGQSPSQPDSQQTTKWVRKEGNQCMLLSS